MSARRLQLYKRKIKKVAIVYRRSTPQALALAKDLSRWLHERKITVFSHPTQKLNDAKPVGSPKDLDLVVVLGGDGTYLEAVRMLNGERVPLLGVNLGGLGFLTVTRVQNLFPMVELALAGKLEVKQRSMIHVEVRSASKVKAEFSALNDVVIERGPASRLIDISLTVDKLPITAIKADGLIVSSPTGSTAYNLAAGGPILHPEVNAIVVTPICPHSLTSRPFVFPNERRLQFQILGDRASRAVLTIDGIKKATIGRNDEVWIDRDSSDHLFLRKVGHNYFSLLKEKLKFGERA